ncbi:MAG: 3-oxo-tetronate kinase [Bacillota bacterium]
MSTRLMIGCVADDFTGASDAASFLISQGLKTVLYNGVPTGDISECNAIVIALKSRTEPTEKAISDSMQAFRWLEEMGCEHLYFKYCSTFDSTKEGNIGPVLDAVLEGFQANYTILSPALPVNGRTVKNGILYVDGVPLGETHMKNHPLTPMWESEIAKLMEPQGKYETLNLNYEILEKPVAEIQKIVEEFGKDKDHFYIVPDYVNDENGTKVAEIFGDCKVLSGGSGILAPLAKKYSEALGKADTTFMETATTGKGLVLAGSCSKATLGQIADFKERKYKSYRINPMDLMEGKETFENIWEFIEKNQAEPVLIYSSDTAENVTKIQEIGKEKVAELLESTTAKLAKKAVENGYTRIIVAGGETSSAVAKMLGYHSFEIGQSVAPGVPVMAPLSDKNMRIVLKSGNFGQVDFFDRAVKMTMEG